ncbi:hypothetical protein GCM10007103_15680 [Salinimicrobium marinum]|uniref:DUF4252 domain-containing protein n=1 Tax=Salinimicrobium marinum TaxID=680283 RepID=A0A918SEJ6_9FLAO|nr:DUF4252 domain-containing protein [Salinimicrobium marinum]GHA35001.1 hypothetical protein GCM10007103_15680 [Salinimicrobium marinum]
MKRFKILLALGALAFYSCDNETTLQEYYVENQGNKQFLALDVPSSLLTGSGSRLDTEQKATLETIKKVNLMAFPMNDENKASYEQEKEKLTAILQNDKYNTLIKYGGGSRKAELYYLGEEDAIDEFVVFGSDEEKGFAVARVLGEDMKPEALIKLLKSFQEGDIDIQGLQSLTSFKD